MTPRLIQRLQLSSDLCTDHPLFWAGRGTLVRDYTFDRELVEAGEWMFEKMIARKIRRSHVTSTGLVMAQKEGNAPKPFEGPLEMAFYLIADFDWAVEGFSPQPFKIEYYDTTGAPRHYFPDALIHFRTDRPASRRLRPLLAEVKSGKSILEEGELHTLQSAAGERFAAAEGMRYAIFTEKEIYTPYWRNAKFLRRYSGFSLPNNGHLWMKSALSAVLGPASKRRKMTIEALLIETAKSVLNPGANQDAIDAKILELMPCLYQDIRDGFFYVDLQQLLTTQSLVSVRLASDKGYSLFL